MRRTVPIVAALLFGLLLVACGGEAQQAIQEVAPTLEAAAEETFALPRTEPIDWSLYPKALGVLGNYQLMHPIDVGDWPLDIAAKRQLFIDDHVIHTIKGRGLECSAAPGNHSALPSEEEVGRLLASHGLSWDRPFERFAPDSPEGQWIARRSEEMRQGIEAYKAQANF